MASVNPPKKNTAYTFYVSLVSQADTRIFKASPTLAAGGCMDTESIAAALT